MNVKNKHRNIFTYFVVLNYINVPLSKFLGVNATENEAEWCAVEPRCVYEEFTPIAAAQYMRSYFKDDIQYVDTAAYQQDQAFE